jgi:hypothetical protein
MQSIDILNLLTDTMFILLVILFVCLILCARLAVTPTGPKDVPVVKQMKKMITQIEKERPVDAPEVRSRQEIITGMFESKMEALGLEPSTDSGYVPVSYTPLARFLKERGVSDDIAGAILDGLMEEETEAEVVAIIDAAAETPEFSLGPEDLAKARELAVEEWKNLRRSA